MEDIQTYFMSGFFEKNGNKNYFDSVVNVDISFRYNKLKLFQDVITQTKYKIAYENNINDISKVTITAFNKLL